jgi:hypothetical protein
MTQRWLEYYLQVQKQAALQLHSNPLIEYGKIIYESPVWKNTRWLVAEFQNEYNVFVDQIFDNGNLSRSLGATFTWKNRAMDFALQMFLVCSGTIRRQNRWIAYE